MFASHIGGDFRGQTILLKHLRKFDGLVKFAVVLKCGNVLRGVLGVRAALMVKHRDGDNHRQTQAGCNSSPFNPLALRFCIGSDFVGLLDNIIVQHIQSVADLLFLHSS